jgi:hypothetical protein
MFAAKLRAMCAIQDADIMKMTRQVETARLTANMFAEQLQSLETQVRGSLEIRWLGSHVAIVELHRLVAVLLVAHFSGCALHPCVHLSIYLTICPSFSFVCLFLTYFSVIDCLQCLYMRCIRAPLHFDALSNACSCDCDTCSWSRKQAKQHWAALTLTAMASTLPPLA